MKKSLWITYISMLFAVTSLAQKTAPPLSLDTLARVGNTIITEQDLIKRIELMPWEGKEKPKTHDSSKIKALNSLVAERLLAIEGKHQNIGTDEISELKIRGMEKMFVRDELFNREVKQKVTVSENEIRDGMMKFSSQLHLAAIAVKDRNSGDSLWRMLQRNVTLEKIFTTIQPRYITSVETVQVNFGGLDTLFENAVYAIGKKKFTKPFISNTYGWTIAVLLDRGTNPVYEKMNLVDRRIRVDEIIRRKKENITAGRYYSKTLAPEKAKTDSVLFYILSKQLRSLILEDSARHRNKGLYGIMTEDVDRLLSVNKNELKKPFIELSDQPLTFGEVIESLRNLRFGFPSLDATAFSRALNSHLRTLVATELIAREGYRQNLQYSEPVQKDLQEWSNYWISRYLMWQVDDSIIVSNDEILTALKSSLPAMGNRYFVNVQEVLSDSLATAIRVLREYSNGRPLSELAKTYSLRKEWKDRGGVSQWMPLNQHSEITCRAFLADTGTIVGPIQISEGYSLFKVLEKKSAGTTDMPTTDSIVINIKNNLLGKKRGRAMSSYVATLAKNYSVDIRYEKLPSVKVQPANMFTRRIIGFGGIITAAPMVYPNWEWMKEYRSREQELP